jgi:hypothetical protein
LCSLLASAARAQEIASLRLSRHADYSRLVIEFSELPRYRVHELPDPTRLIIDFPDASLAVALEQLDLRGTPIVDIRSGMQKNGDLRLVLEFESAAVKANTFLLKPDLGRPDRLVIELFPGESGLREVALAAQPEAEAEPDVAAPPPPTATDTADAADAQVVADSADFDATTEAASDVDAAVESERRGGSSWDLAFSGTWEQEWGVYTDGGDSQKFEALVEPRFDLEHASGVSITTILRLRLDTMGNLGPDASRPDNYSDINGPFFNSAEFEFSLREMYLDAEWGSAFWRIGKQQVVWGQADGIKVLDVVNPQSFREFILDDFDDSRIPLTMVNVEIPVAEESTLQLLWIPDTSYHELAEAGTPYFLTSSRLVPQAPPGLDIRVAPLDKPDDPFSDSDAGARLSAFVGGWDLTLNYLYHYQDFPVLYQSLGQVGDGELEGVISPGYERNHLVGGTLSNVLSNNLTLRAELAHNSDTFHVSRDLSRQSIEPSAEISAVVGLDWQPGSDTFISGQFFQSSLLDYESSISRDKNERNASLLLQQTFLNETLQFNGLLLYNLNDEDTWTQLKLKYVLRSNLEIWVGADLFNGDRDGLFGQFRDTDRALVGLKLGF